MSVGQNNKTTLRVEGIDQAIMNLHALGNAVGKKIGQKAMNKALDPMLKQARMGIQKDTGFSQKAIAKKVKFYKNTGIVLGLIGADSKFKTFKYSDKTGKTHYHRPSKILHFLEFGTKKMQGSRFLTRAYNTTLAITQSIFAQQVNAEIDKLRFKHTR